MQAQLQNQAGAALVRHIKWWQHCFFRCLNLASKKDGTFDILSTCTKYCTTRWIILESPKIDIAEKLPEIWKFAPYQLLPVVTCVGVWVVTVGSVSCLGNSQVITKSCLKFVNLPLITWLVYSRLPISNPRVINRTKVEVPYLGDWLGPRFFPFVYQGYY